MTRHAYLVMCHTNFDQLCILLDILDDSRNDIYLHIDKKSKGYSVEEIQQHVKKANLFILKPMRVNWGGDTQIKLEIYMLSEATKTQHSYYHLISGMDLPLKTQDEIHEFFIKNSGYDYVSLSRNMEFNKTKSFMDKVNFYYFVQNYISRDPDRLFNKIHRQFVKLQKLIGINRTKRLNMEFQKGANWFSITHDTALYVIDEYEKTKKIYRYTLCADEIFLQTILVNSPRIDKVKDDYLRFIDWKRGTPYTFKEEDYDTLMQSDDLFARKFDIKVDAKIINMIRDRLLSDPK